MDEKRDIIEDLHRPARKHFKRRSYVIKGLNDLWQADLADYSKYSDENRGYKWLLVVIDAFTKVVYIEALKTKSGTEVTEAFEKILKRAAAPKNLHVDQGTEFYNAKFKALMKKYKINMYSTFSHLKASIVERVLKNLKSRIEKNFHLQGSYNYVDYLRKIVQNYNNTWHRKIKMKPNDVNKKNEKLLLDTVYKLEKDEKKAKFEPNDIVRISKNKTLFEKGYTANWGTELFTVASRNDNTNPITYNLIDGEGQPIYGVFYSEELQKARHPDVFLVEKVLKRKGDKEYVKWLGFDEKYNSWI